MFYEQKTHPIVAEILNCSITSASQLYMKYSLGCFEIDDEFCSDFISTLISSNDNGFKIMRDCIRHGWLVELFKENKTISFLVENMDSSKFLIDSRKNVVSERCKALLCELSSKRPGLIIGYYLKNKPGPISQNKSKVNSSFEQLVVKLSSRMAKVNPKYAEIFHNKVMEKYEETWTRENLMK